MTGLFKNVSRPRAVAQLCLFALALPAAAQWRTGYFLEENTSGQTAQTIPWSKYTHVVDYGAAPAIAGGTCSLKMGPGMTDESSRAFVDAAHAAGVKALLGISEDPSLAAIEACTGSDNLAQFVQAISSFVSGHGYDGVDLEWGSGVLNTPYQAQYQDLVRQLRSAMPQATLAAVLSIASASVASPLMGDLDQLNIMAGGRDLYGTSAPVAAHVSPSIHLAQTQSNALDRNFLNELSKTGIPPSKAGLAVPFFGKVEQGCLDSSGGVGITAPGQTSLSGISTRPISLADLIASPYWTSGSHVWDAVQQSEYISYTGGGCSADRFIPYAGPEQMQAAASQMQTDGLGGIMTFGLPYEYLSAQSGDARYPLSTTLDASITAATQASQLAARALVATPKSTAAYAQGRTTKTQTSQAAYYLDAVNGNDSNAGTSTSPKQHLASLPTLAPGVSVYLMAGETWRETLTVNASGTATSPIVFGVYGTGASPIISASNLISTGWTDYSGSIWAASVSTQPRIVYFNGVLGIPVASTAAVTAANDWYWQSGVLYVYSASGNPGTAFTSPGIEAGARNRAAQTSNTSYITFDGITFRDGNLPWDTTLAIGFTTVQGIVVKNCVVERGVASGISSGGDSTANALTIQNTIVRNNGGWGIYIDSPFTSATISGNTISANGWRSVTDGQEYDGIEGPLGNFTITGNTIYANAAVCVTLDFCHGIYADSNSGTVTISQNTIYGQPTGGAIKTRAPANIYQNTLYNNYGEGVQVGGNSLNIAVTIYGNIIYGNDTCNCAAGILELEGGPGTIALTIENNTVFQNANTGQAEVKISDNIQSLTLLNNILFTTPTRRTIDFLTTLTGTLNINYNLQWRSDGNPSIIYNDNVLTWAQWNAMGYDKFISAPVNPMLSNPPSSFTLSAGSPAIGKGEYILGLSLSSSPNIGAE